MLISEIFLSIQGESLQAGLSTVFIRTAGCNLDCVWCDTRYAREGGTEITVAAIIAAVRDLDMPRVCLTGGEPLLQADTPELCAGLLQEEWDLQVETNGSLDITVLPAGTRTIMDIKCPGSGISDPVYPGNPAALRPGDELKCVIADVADYTWALDFVSRECPEDIPVIFSPARECLESRVLAEWLCRDRVSRIRFQLPLHSVLWPGQRGR